MLRCALDGRRGSVRLVLAACSAPPEVLEGHCFPRTVQPERVLTRLEAWRESYGVVLDRLTCCAEDPLPDGLIAALEADGCRIEWLRRDDVAAVMAAWQQIRPDPRWDRAGLMAALAEARLEAAPSETAHFTALAQNWLYTWLLQQVADVRAWLVRDDLHGQSGTDVLEEIPF